MVGGDHVEKTSLEPEIQNCLEHLRTLHMRACCWFFLIIAVMFSRYWCPPCNIKYAFMPRSTNHDAVLSNVVLIRAQIGNERAHFRIEFMHSAKFVVMWPNLLLPSYAWVHFCNGILSQEATSDEWDLNADNFALNIGCLTS